MTKNRTVAAALAVAVVLAGLWTITRGFTRPAPRASAVPAADPMADARRADSTAAEFVAWWHDGKAEVGGYRYAITRYGELRTGTAVAIYVTEPFSASRRVKVDDPARDPRDTHQVLKLNLVRDFQTGIYDYDTMLSVFARTESLAPVKVSFSSTEWCGNVYEELSLDPGRMRQQVFSYFEGESGTSDLPRPAGGVLEDELFVRLRGLRGAFLAPGERRRVPFLASAFYRRLAHRPARWSSATIERGASAERVIVPAGAFDAVVYDVRTDDGRAGRFWIESAPPHRLLKWAWRAVAPERRMDGLDEAELAGSERVEYWRLHQSGDERRLRELGLVSPAGTAAH